MDRCETVIVTAIGTIRITGGADRLDRIEIGVDAPPAIAGTPLLREAAAQLDAYLAGRLARFDLPLAPAATSRGAILRATIVAVPLGETASYGDLAKRIGSGARAIGQACARNPLPLVVPCHRVLAAGGRLGFYSAGEGAATKGWLLDHERAMVAAAR